MSLRKKILYHWLNLYGFKTNRKIVVFESDDWGSIRMPSRNILEKLIKKGFPLDKRPFESRDSLESSDDLSALLETLSKFKDKNGNHPVFTANTIMANPDFEKIKSANFDNYYNETFIDTYNKYHSNSSTFEVIKDGINQKMYFPQYHGREHYNIKKWMSKLKSNDKDTLLAFEHGMVGLPSISDLNAGNRLLINLDFETKNDLINLESQLKQGAQLFEKVFGFNAKSFIAPVYTWHPSMELTLNDIGIDYIQGGRVQISPIPNSEKREYIYHFLGQKNEFDQFYLVRNVSFEPYSFKVKAQLDSTITSIEKAFKNRRPAIISTHRLNYIGSIDERNRKDGLKYLEVLLRKILSKWDDIEFLTTVELGKLVGEKK